MKNNKESDTTRTGNFLKIQFIVPRQFFTLLLPFARSGTSFLREAGSSRHRTPLGKAGNSGKKGSKGRWKIKRERIAKLKKIIKKYRCKFFC